MKWLNFHKEKVPVICYGKWELFSEVQYSAVFFFECTIGLCFITNASLVVQFKREIIT